MANKQLPKAIFPLSKSMSLDDRKGGDKVEVFKDRKKPRTALNRKTSGALYKHDKGECPDQCRFCKANRDKTKLEKDYKKVSRLEWKSKIFERVKNSKAYNSLYEILRELSVLGKRHERNIFFTEQRTRREQYRTTILYKDGIKKAVEITNWCNIPFMVERYVLPLELWERLEQGKKDKNLSSGLCLDLLESLERVLVNTHIHPSTNLFYWLGFNRKVLNFLKKAKKIGVFQIRYPNTMANRTGLTTYYGLKLGKDYTIDLRTTSALQEFMYGMTAERWKQNRQTESDGILNDLELYV